MNAGLRSKRARAAILGACLGLVAMVAVCPDSISAATSSLTPEDAAARMETARNEIAITRSNIVLTLDLLNQVRYAPDPRAQYAKFTAQLAVMEQRANLTRERAREMKRRGDAYFADWEARTAAIQDPQRRRDTEASYARRKQSYDRIIMFMQKAGKDFTPMLAALKEVKATLEGNPAAKAAGAASDSFMRANWRCTDVQRSLMEVEIEFDLLAADFRGAQQ